ncbi:glycerol-3-phosphate dehydrogenase [Leeia sp. TBRC 13508]|uniref:Glycerol-3-phosphate dehydrogenase n=1 Tax=Leeia speluncae TaxID=2884804 RepID=A0ABS8D6P7_9NEIS|nr:glycerol-3-phosphate dehydrogenase [Leeia speluncae]MCB6183875.1 glycerol-3-phosphate dehydrogenase [Leeia speluncae]
MLDQIFDVIVIGGGINGAGIARDAAGRGLSVLLCEKDDLAEHTSSASTKLIHGGLRYLEYGEFSLVRKALQEREVLLDSAPHIMWPLRFVMPHNQHLRPAWMIRLGLFLYDHLAARKTLAGSAQIRLDQHETGLPLKSSYSKGFMYSDGWVDDARLVVLNARDAALHGAKILTRTKCIQAQKTGEHWVVTLRNEHDTFTVKSKSIVNAAGPWAASFLDDAGTNQPHRSLRLIKGSHIVVPRLFDHECAYIFQNPDRRIMFAIPYEHDFTLIGTTDVDYIGDPGDATISNEEIDYLCKMSSEYFTASVTPDMVKWHYSGVRPLLDDEHSNAASVTRDYSLELVTNGPALLNVFGGKITTFRVLAETAVNQLVAALGLSCKPWTSKSKLPGGHLGSLSKTAYIQSVCEHYPHLPTDMVARVAQLYGSEHRRILGNAKSLSDLGGYVIPGMTASEIQYLRKYEWAVSAKDILWRRTKLGLHVPDCETTLQNWLVENPT